MVMLVGCTSLSCKAKTDSETAKSSEVVPKQQASTASVDYTARGVPSPDRQWLPADYNAAVEVLAKLSSEDPMLLPRYRGPGSAVFARMVSPDNFSILANKSLPLDQRMPLALELLPAIKGSLVIYLNSNSSKHFFGDELVELQAHQLAAVIAMSGAVSEFTATLSLDDPKNQVRKDGLSKMRRGFGMMINGSIVTLSETNLYSERQLIRFAGYLERLLPRLLSSLPDSIRIESKGQLAKLGTTTSSTPLKAALVKIEKAISQP